MAKVLINNSKVVLDDNNKVAVGEAAPSGYSVKVYGSTYGYSNNGVGIYITKINGEDLTYNYSKNYINSGGYFIDDEGVNYGTNGVKPTSWSKFGIYNKVESISFKKTGTDRAYYSLNNVPSGLTNFIEITDLNEITLTITNNSDLYLMSSMEH